MKDMQVGQITFGHSNSYGGEVPMSRKARGELTEALPWAVDGDHRYVDIKITHDGMIAFARTTVDQARKLKKMGITSKSFDVNVTGICRLFVSDQEIMPKMNGPMKDEA